jgi:citrate synthase
LRITVGVIERDCCPRFGESRAILLIPPEQHPQHGEKPRDSWVQAMHTSLILYAEHEFNASTFACRVIAGTGSDMYSAIAGGIGALRGPKHGGANEVAFEVQKRYESPMRRKPISRRGPSPRKS